MDITREELKENGQRKALEIMVQALEIAGLDPDEYDLSLIKRKGNPKAAPNIQVFQTAAYLAATCLKSSANQVLMYFLSISEFENFISIDQTTLSEELKMSKSAVEKSLRELSENGIIIKTKYTKDKRRNEYYLNPMSAWKGKTLNRKIALQQAFNENKNQLHLFGETYEENILREAEEIRKKRPNLFLTGGK